MLSHGRSEHRIAEARLGEIMRQISRLLDELEKAYRETAPAHLPRSGGPVREYGRMISGRIRECRDLYDWSIHARDRIGSLINLRSLGARYGVSYQTVYRYIDHTLGTRPTRWASTRGAGKTRI